MYFILVSCILVSALGFVCSGVSTKLDFDDTDQDTTVVTNSSQITDDDVEVKHTIVLSTKVKNNNRRGIHTNNDESGIIITQGRPDKAKKIDSGEVPVYNGFRAIETTQIRTPDTRIKPKDPEPVVISRNVDDELDVYPNFVNHNQWKPSSYYNNINWWTPNDRLVTYNINRNPEITPAYRQRGKYHRKISEDGIKEFYCGKCRDMIRGSRGIQQHSPLNYETTTKIKIDGKLAKLN